MPTAFWAAWMLVASATLPVSHMLMPEDCNGATRLVVDIHQPNYTVQFGVCEDESETCQCSVEDHSLLVVEAHLYSDDEVYELPHGYHSFDVALREPYMTLGVHHYKVNCSYVCILPLRRCKGKSRSIDLIVEVVDFELKLIESDLLEDAGMEEGIDVPKGSHVTMMCSSGLDHTQGSNSSDIKTQFLFTAKGATNITKSVDCDQELVKDGDWIVSRQSEPPYDCLLNISNFDSENVGEYSCTAFLPREQSQYVTDRSPSSIKLYLKDQGPGNSKTRTVIIAGVVAGVVAVALVLGLIVLATHVRNSHRRARHGSPYTSLISHRSLRQSYSAISQRESPIPSIEAESQTLVGSDVGVEIVAAQSASLGRGSVVPSEATPITVVDVPLGETEEGNKNNLLKEPSQGHLLAVESGEEASRSRLSTMSEGTEGRQYYKDHTDINRPVDGRTTPDEPHVPYDDNFECKYCGKKYRANQRLFYKRHVDELEIRCPKCKPEPASHPAPEDKKDDKDTSFQTSGSDVGSLSFNMAGSVPPSSVSTQPSSTSSGPPSSVGQEGQRIYNKIMKVEPATGTTPESRFPIDPHYVCSKCGKQYHTDQRMYLTRHVKENRCGSCSASGGKQESKEDSNTQH